MTRKDSILIGSIIAGAYLLAAMWFCHPLVYGPVPDEKTGKLVSRFHNYFYDSHERLQNVLRLSEFHDALTHGQWLPRLCRNFEGGYGYPFFNFYAPLSYYLADVWHVLGFDLYMAWKVHFLLMTFLSGWFAYLYARLFFVRAAAFAAGMMYLMAPYHLVNLYVRGNVAEFTAMTVLPLMLYCFHRLAREPGRARWFAGAALSFGALILTHNITAMTGGAFLALYLVVLILNVFWFIDDLRLTIDESPNPSSETQVPIPEPRIPIPESRTSNPESRIPIPDPRIPNHYPLLTLPLAAFAGGMLTAFFWLPAIIEMKYCQTAGLHETFGEYAKHFVRWREFAGNEWGFGMSADAAKQALLGIMPLSLGWAQIAGVFSASILLVMSLRKGSVAVPSRRVGMFYVVALVGALFLMTSQSAYLWKIPGAQLVQFPWRLLVIASFCAAMCCGYFAHALAEKNWWLGWGSAAALLIALAIVSAPKIEVYGYFKRPASLHAPEETRKHFINTNIGEFRPVWVRQRPTGGDGEKILSERRVRGEGDSAVVAVFPEFATDVRVEIAKLLPEAVRYEMDYFPGWKVYCDGVPIEVRPSDPYGSVEFTLHHGRHEYHIYFGWSPAHTAGAIISIFTLLLFLGYIAWRRYVWPRITAALNKPHVAGPEPLFMQWRKKTMTK